MPITPEDRARENIDKLLSGEGWIVQDKRSANLSAARGVAVREFPLKSGHGEADYLLFVDGAPIGSNMLPLNLIRLIDVTFSTPTPDFDNIPSAQGGKTVL